MTEEEEVEVALMLKVEEEEAAAVKVYSSSQGSWLDFGSAGRRR